MERGCASCRTRERVERLKKTFQAVGLEEHPQARVRTTSWPHGGRPGPPNRMTPSVRWSATRPPPSCWRRPGCLACPGLDPKAHEYRLDTPSVPGLDKVAGCGSWPGPSGAPWDFAARCAGWWKRSYPEVRGPGQSQHPPAHPQGVRGRSWPGCPADVLNLEFHEDPVGTRLNMRTRVQRLVPLLLTQRLPDSCAREGSPWCATRPVEWRKTRTPDPNYDRLVPFRFQRLTTRSRRDCPDLACH